MRIEECAMSFNYDFACKPRKSGVWEQRFEVTPGEHGIKMDVKLNVEVIPMSGDRKKVFGAVEEIKLINWPEGLDGGIAVFRAYNSEGDAREDPPYVAKVKDSPPKNLLERTIAYKHVVGGNNSKQTTSPMVIRLLIDWLPKESVPEDSEFDAKSNPNPGLKLKSSDGICLYLKGDWIDGFSTLLKRYREGNYDQKVSKSDDGCFECPEFDAVTLWVLFCYGQYKMIPLDCAFNEKFVDVMRAANHFGANRACGDLFAMQTQRLILAENKSAREYLELWHHAINYNLHEMKLVLARDTHLFIEKMQRDQAIYDEYRELMANNSVTESMSMLEYLHLCHFANNLNLTEMKLMLARHTHSFIDEMKKDPEIWDEYCQLMAGTLVPNLMSVREYLNLWHYASNYNLPEMKLMLARHTHSFINEMQKNQAIWDEYCKLMARTLVPNSMSVRKYLDLWHYARNHDLPKMKLILARHKHSFFDEMKKDSAIYDEYCKLMAGIESE